MSKPNILVFITDQMRADHLGCYGNPDVQTPKLDRLAAEGTTFTESYVANPLCMPNRATLFTGVYPKVHGVRENGISLHPSHPVLPDLLAQSGYETASFGKLHLLPYSIDLNTPLDEWERYESPEYWENHDTLPTPYYGLQHVYYTGGHGPYTFGQYRQEIGEERHRLLAKEHALEPPTGAKESWKSAIPEAYHYNTRIADESIKFLQSRDGSTPFFAWCSFPDPHHPYMPPAPYCYQYDPATITFDPARRDGELDDLPPYIRDAREGKIQLGGLQGGSQVSDDEFREILAHTYGMISMVDANIGRVLDAVDLDNTVVVFMSDHGDLMGDHWLINKGPFPYRGLMRVPTIWRVPGAAAGIQHNNMVSAVDFAPTVLDFAGVELPTHMQGVSYREMVSGGNDPSHDAVYMEYDSTYLQDRLRCLRTHEWSIACFANSDAGFIYNLRDDPNELYNLWYAPDYQQTKLELKARLLQESIRTDSWQPSKKAHA